MPWVTGNIPALAGQRAGSVGDWFALQGDDDLP